MFLFSCIFFLFRIKKLFIKKIVFFAKNGNRKKETFTYGKEYQIENHRFIKSFMDLKIILKKLSVKKKKKRVNCCVLNDSSTL